MAIDFLIFGLLAISFFINLVALGAFWVTPGLRTTANRFVINLLIVNLIGCFLLAPTLFLNDNNYNKANDATVAEDHLSVHIRRHDRLIENDEFIQNGSEEKILECNSKACDQITIDKSGDSITFTEFETDGSLIQTENVKAFKHYNTKTDEDNEDDEVNGIGYGTPSYQLDTRWTLDLAVAIVTLSVLLIVGDTWCAVTDPLRYHSRMSDLKVWILIVIAWTLSIFFGALSALRDMSVFESETIIRREGKVIGNYSNSEDETITQSDRMEVVTIEYGELYSVLYTCFYFVFIILLPFGFVCGMYWRIISEARENGLRMRQNGSSPLLQSALNLATHNQQANSVGNSLTVQRNSISGSTGCGLQMKIDQYYTRHHDHRPSIERDEKSSMPELMYKIDEKKSKDRRQNILLTLSTDTEDVKRNYSARQLQILSSSSQDFLENKRKPGMRQVQSSPNLQRYAQIRTNSLTGLETTSSHNHILQIPVIHASPKAINYMTSIRHRLSNASSLFKYREESRAARISILVVIMFLVSYLPYGCLILLEERVLDHFAHTTQLAIFMVLLGNISSPFIFAYRNKRVRRGVKRLLRIDANSKDKRFQRKIGSGLLRTKASINVNRSTSKASTCSVNSYKYLSPHLLCKSNNNVSIEKRSFNNMLRPCSSSLLHPKTIMEHVVVDTRSFEKRSILKKFCYNSRKLGCASKSCADSVDNEPVEV